METKNKYKKIYASRNIDESGYAMILALGIVILTIGILTSMTLLTIKDVQSSSKNRGVLEARISGESAVDSLYAAINASGEKSDITEALKAFKLFGTTTPIVPTGAGSTGTEVDGVTKTTYGWSTYYGIDSNGAIGACPALGTTPCFRMRLIKVITKPDYTDDIANNANVDDISAKREEYVIDIVTRTKCQPNTTINCSYSRIQQNISLRKYVEYVSISASESIADVVRDNAGVPGSALNTIYSLNNYYSGQDKVSGKIHTNDNVIRACNNFNQGVTSWITAKGSAGSSTAGVFPTSANGCDQGATDVAKVKKATRVELALPDRSGDTDAVFLETIAAGDDAEYFGYRNVVFKDNGTYDIDGEIKKMPSSGVMYFNDESKIQGVVSGRITIVSKPGTDIVIDGNLTYEGGTVTTSANKDMTGVYSGKDIKILCRNIGTGPCTPIEIHAFLKASITATYPGTIWNPNWATSKVASAGAAPPLTLFGAMESYYRGTFGSIDSTSENVQTGFKKAFTYDSRLLNQQPPFMLRDGTVPFIRNAVKDVPCGSTPTDTVCKN